jgi:hypothetical protein
MVFIGFGLFGAIDQVPGRCHVATRFFYLSGIPLLPLDSWAVLERPKGTEVTSVRFLTQVVTGINVGSEERVEGARVPLNLMSILMTYVRAVLWILHGPATALLLMLGIGCLLTGMPQNTNWAGIVTWLVAPSVGGGLLLWLSYRLNRATPARAEALRAMLGLPGTVGGA